MQLVYTQLFYCFNSASTTSTAQTRQYELKMLTLEWAVSPRYRLTTFTLWRTDRCRSLTCPRTKRKPSLGPCDRHDFANKSFTVSFWFLLSVHKDSYFIFLTWGFFTVLLQHRFQTTLSAEFRLLCQERLLTVKEGLTEANTHLRRKSKFWSIQQHPCQRGSVFLGLQPQLLTCDFLVWHN